MKTTATFAILFWINASRKKNNHAKLYVRITVNGIRATISLKHKININKWDKSKQRIKGKDIKDRNINHYLDQVQIKLFQSYQDLNTEQKPLSAQSVKSRFLGEDTKYHTMQDVITYHNQKMKNSLQDSSMRLYQTNQKYILQFIKREYKVADINLKDIDYSFIIGFENFLRSYYPKQHKKTIQNNAVMKHIQRLRKLVTLAYHMEWIYRDPFVKFKLKYTKVERGFLSKEELYQVENTTFLCYRQSLVKDLFVFSCYTGISYIDMQKLTKENIVLGIDTRYWIITTRQKTGSKVKVPLLSKAEQLIDKYEQYPKRENTLFPSYSNVSINKFLKEIASICNIEKKLTFHMARHTFATTVTLSNGVPIETVSKLLGHSTITTTQIYAKVIERKVSDDMQKLQELFSTTNLRNTM